MNIPRDEVFELRWLQDRIRLVQLEAQMAIRELQDRIDRIVHNWKEQYGIVDIDEYELRECELVKRGSDGSDIRVGQR